MTFARATPPSLLQSQACTVSPAVNTCSYLIDNLQSSVTPQGGIVSQVIPQVLSHLRQHVEAALVCHIPYDLAISIPAIERDT